MFRSPLLTYNQLTSLATSLGPNNPLSVRYRQLTCESKWIIPVLGHLVQFDYDDVHIYNGTLPRLIKPNSKSLWYCVSTSITAIRKDSWPNTGVSQYFDPGYHEFVFSKYPENFSLFNKELHITFVPFVVYFVDCIISILGGLVLIHRFEEQCFKQSHLVDFLSAFLPLRLSRLELTWTWNPIFSDRIWFSTDSLLKMAFVDGWVYDPFWVQYHVQSDASGINLYFGTPDTDYGHLFLCSPAIKSWTREFDDITLEFKYLCQKKNIARIEPEELHLVKKKETEKPRRKFIESCDTKEDGRTYSKRNGAIPSA
ncbi:hypothetical protein RF11_08695 [Thelohanellus kitauei]|uniref:Uncharacterized protein n=1 Tax=Thelohanellus kitauei TaxID=669202 RepID=A0A0C2MWP2_THEKT|nr:hypothetical protein RF11_08695 [Thelohanellus kitauei]